MDKRFDLSKEDLIKQLDLANNKIKSLESDADFFAARVKSLTTELTQSKQDISSLWYSLAIIGSALNVDIPERGARTPEEHWLDYAKAIESTVAPTHDVDNTPGL